MKKKVERTRKLTLSRETLVKLEGLKEVQGGLLDATREPDSCRFCASEEIAC